MDVEIQDGSDGMNRDLAEILDADETDGNQEP